MALETFGRQLREYREERGLGQTEAAKRAQISRHTLINWEGGKTQPRHRDELLHYARDVLHLTCEQTHELLVEAYGDGLTEEERRTYFPGHPPPAVQPHTVDEVQKMGRELLASLTRLFSSLRPPEEKARWTWQVVLWLALLALSLVGLAGLGDLLLGTIHPLARFMARTIVAILLIVTGSLGFPLWRESLPALDRQLQRPLPLWAGVIALLFVTLGLWAGPGRTAYCRTHPCGERVVLVKPFAGRELAHGEVEEAISLTRARIEQSLRRTGHLHVMPVMESRDPFTLNQIDLQISGYYENYLRLVTDLSDGLGRPLADPIEVRAKVSSRQEVEALQKELGRRLLEAIGIPPAHAHAALEATFALSPDALAANQAGVAAYQQGRLDEAGHHFGQALQAEPDYDEALINLGVVYAAQGRYAEAEASLQRALTLDPKSPYAYYNLGSLYSARQEWKAAIQAYKQAIRFFPGYVQAFNNLADAYLEMGNRRQARSVLEKGLALAPDAFYLHKNLGRLALTEGDAPTAIAELKRALEGNPAYPEAQFYLAQAYTLAGERAAACQALADYESLGVPHDPHQQEAHQLWQELNCPEGGS